MKLARLLLLLGGTLFILGGCFKKDSLMQSNSGPRLKFIKYEFQENLVAGAWQIVRLHLANDGENDFIGTLIGYQVEPRVEGSYRVDGESYSFPLEIAKGSQKVLELKIPGRKWRALGLDLRINGFNQELGPILFDRFKLDYIPLAKTHFDARVCWVVGKKEAPREFLYPILRENKYNIDEHSPAQLPRSWLGYQSLELLVLLNESLESLDPQQAKAIKIFANTGGRILLFSGSDIASGNPLFAHFPPVGKASDFQTGFKHIIGYEISSETRHFMVPRYAPGALLNENSTANLTGVVAKLLAPSIPTKEMVLMLLGAFFLVALVGNRIFCNKVLRRPEMTYPIFLVCSFLYFFGVYSLGWQSEDRDIKRLESSFAYMPPTGDQMYVRTIETLISGVAQSLREVRLSSDTFILPQSVEDLDTYYRSSIGSKISGEFENSQQGIIHQSYLKPNAIAAFCVDRILPKTVSYTAEFLDAKKEKNSEEREDWDHSGERQDQSVSLRVRTSDPKDNLVFVLFYKDRYFYSREKIAGVRPRGTSGDFTEYDIRFNTSDADLGKGYYYSSNSASSEVYYLKQIFSETLSETAFKKMTTELYRFGVTSQTFQILDQQRLPKFSEQVEVALAKIVENWSAIDRDRLFVKQLEYGQGWSFTWQNNQYLLKKAQNDLVIYQYSKVHPFCRLYVFYGSPISPVFFKGKLTTPRKKSVSRYEYGYNYGYNEERIQSQIYVVPVEVPKEHW